MTKHILTYGSIGGIGVVLFFFASQPFLVDDNGHMDFELGEIMGYASMIISLSVIFFGIRSYRDNHLGGQIKFLKSLSIGLLITLVASVFYVVGWMIYFEISDSASQFMDQYMEHAIVKMQEEGASEVKIEEFKTEMGEFAKMYENPFVRAGITLMEIFPVGLIISLISSLILKRTDIKV